MRWYARRSAVEDNEVNLADFGTLAYAFGSAVGACYWIQNADLDQDGEVNLADFGIMAANFGFAGDE